MTVWRGGRGVKAPYETTHVRIPVDLKKRVEELSKAYKDGLLEANELPLQRDEGIELRLKTELEQLQKQLATLQAHAEDTYQKLVECQKSCTELKTSSKLLNLDKVKVYKLRGQDVVYLSALTEAGYQLQLPIPLGLDK
jgi:hypothetical protein